MIGGILIYVFNLSGIFLFLKKTHASFTFIERNKFKKILTLPSADKDVGKWDSYILLEGVQNVTATLEKALAVPVKLNIDLSYDPSISFLSFYPRKTKTMSEHQCLYQFYSELPQTGNNSNVLQCMNA